MANPMLLEVVSDTICPWCYIGKRHLEAALPVLAAKGHRFDVIWRPFQLNPEMPVAGTDRRAYRTTKFGSWQRGLELDVQVADVGQRVGLVFRHDLMRRTPNSLASHALVALAHADGGGAMQDRVVEALFSAYFTRGADIGDRAVLTGIAADCGLDAARVSAALDEPAGLDAFARADRHARERTFRGVPSFVLEGQFLFSGAMSADAMVSTLRDAAARIGSFERTTPSRTA